MGDDTTHGGSKESLEKLCLQGMSTFGLELPDHCIEYLRTVLTVAET